MALQQSRRVALAAALLVCAVAGMVLYKIHALGYAVEDILPVTQYRLTYALGLDGHAEDARVRSFLPVSDAHQQVSEEREDSTPELHFTQQFEGLDRTATWSGAQVPDGARVRHSLSVLSTAVRYTLSPQLQVPSAYPASVAGELRPEDAIQVDAPEIHAALVQIGADQGTVLERLTRIHDFTAGLGSRPFKGTTDALTALRLEEASCNGKSRLFVALTRAAGIPARLVGGLILESGSKKTSHQWVEAYVGGHWVPFCPTNHHFAFLPARYLTLYHGDQSLFRHTADINFDYQFEVSSSLVPSPRAKERFTFFNVWGLFERLGQSFALLRTILMLPLGALLVVLFRNVIGLPTFGTFLPALLAAAAGETGAGWGVIAVLAVVAVVAGVRWMVQRLELLHSPTLAILLTAVSLTVLGLSLLADRLGLASLANITFFPIAVLAICAERFYLVLTEKGPLPAGKELAGTLVVMLACSLVMNSLALQVVLVGFPEVLLLAVAANIYLGRWVGMRLSEYRRFRGILLSGRTG